MAYLLDGETEMTVSGEMFNLKTGEMFIMPVNESHALKAKKKYKMLLL